MSRAKVQRWMRAGVLSPLSHPWTKLHETFGSATSQAPWVPNYLKKTTSTVFSPSCEAKSRSTRSLSNHSLWWLYSFNNQKDPHSPPNRIRRLTWSRYFVSILTRDTVYWRRIREGTGSLGSLSSRNQYVLDFNSTIINHSWLKLLRRPESNHRSRLPHIYSQDYSRRSSGYDFEGKTICGVHWNPCYTKFDNWIPQRPNSNFYRQLNLFYDSQGKVSRTDKDIRRFYLERTVHEVTSAYRTSILRTTLKNSSQAGMARD